MIRGDRTYLVTGGTSGLGLETACWLVRRGARNVALIGRGAPSSAAQQVIAGLAAHGAKATVAAIDVSDRPALHQFLKKLDAPLGGVIHCAGALSDALLVNQTWEHFERTYRAKVEGTWNLHELTAGEPLDFFVLFSSIAALLGAPGQANHAAANTFEDAVAHMRRASGLPATSINWGAWSGTGSADREDLERRRQTLGLKAFTTEEGLQLFDQILQSQPVQVAAARMNWRVFRSRQHSQARTAVTVQSGVLRSEEDSATPEKSLTVELAATPVSGRTRVIQKYLRSQALRILGFSPERSIDPVVPLQELGLDSLMAVEFGNAVSAAVGRRLPVTLLFDYPTITDLTRYLAKELIPQADAGQGVAAAKSSSEDKTTSAPFSIATNTATGTLEALSDEDVDRMLAERLGRL